MKEKSIYKAECILELIPIKTDKNSVNNRQE